MKILKYLAVTLLYIVLFNITATAQYNLKVGEVEHLSITPPKGTVRNSTWQCDEGLTFTDRSEYGAIVKVTKYFSGAAYVHCQYSYEYLGTYDNNWHAGTGTQTYRITCISGNATISKTDLSLNPGQKYKLSCTRDDSYGTPVWESSNEDVATVDQNGNVKAISSGYARITVDPIIAAPLICDVNVKVLPPTSITLSPNPLTITNGGSGMMTAKLLPNGATANLTWKSIDESVATVSSSGEVKGCKAGSTTIKVTTDNGLSASANVIVEKSKVKLSYSANGDGLLVKGAKVKLTTDVDNAMIYYTLDGSTPTRVSTQYTSPITLERSCTLKAIACKEGYLDSDILTQSFSMTSLMATNAYPANEATDVQYFTVPEITFNGNINIGKNFNNVVLEGERKNGNDTLEVKCHIFRNKLIIEPTRNLTRNKYILTIPQGAVMNENGEDNISYTSSFYTKSAFIDNVIPFTDYKSTLFITKNDKSVWGCGYNSLAGILGLNNYADQKKLVQCDFYDLKDVQKAGEYGNILYLQKDGTLLTRGEKYNTSKLFTFMTGVEDIQTSFYHYLALKKDGSLWTWGQNRKDKYNKTQGHLGLETSNKDEYYPLHLMDDVKKMFEDDYNSYIIKKDNSLWSWGRNDYGQIGNGSIDSNNDVLIPTHIMNDVDTIAHFDQHVLVIKKDGTLWGWGQNKCGTIGCGKAENSTDSGNDDLRPTPIKILDNVRQVYTNRNVSYALTNDNKLYTWGWNEYGQIGAGETYKYIYTPTLVLEDVAKVKANSNGFGVLKTDGTVWTTGRNKEGENGDGTYKQYKTFKKVADNVKDFTKDASNLFVLKNDNSLWGCGWNKYGQLGDGTTTRSATLRKITDNVESFFGGSFIYAFKTDGSIWAWGYNENYCLGVEQTPIAVKVPTILQQPTVKIDDIKLSDFTKDMQEGESQTITLDLYPSSGDVKEIYWESEDTKKMSISDKGVITAKSEGIAPFNVKVITANGAAYTLYDHVNISKSSNGINAISEKTANAKVYAGERQIRITPEQKCNIKIYSIGGNLIFNRRINKETTISNLSRGGYIVRINESTIKVAL